VLPTRLISAWPSAASGQWWRRESGSVKGEVKGSTVHTHTHRQRSTPPTPTHTHTHDKNNIPQPPNKHLPHTLNNARRRVNPNKREENGEFRIRRRESGSVQGERGKHINSSHTHTHTDRKQNTRHRHIHTTRTTSHNLQTNTSHKHLPTLEGGATTVRATSHARVNVAVQFDDR